MKYDLESLVIAVTLVILSRAFSYAESSSVLALFSVLLSFGPPLLISFKIVKFAKQKGAFRASEKAALISVAAILIIPIVFIPMSLFQYLTSSYVTYTFYLILACTFFGPKLYLWSKFRLSLKAFVSEIQVTNKTILIIQFAFIAFISFYLSDLYFPISPIDMNIFYLIMLVVVFVITSYFCVRSNLLKYFSVLSTAMFLFSFFAIQNIVYFGGDSGLFISVTKYLADGGEANIVSPFERWRIGSLAFLGYPSLAAYLEESSQANIEMPLPYANAISIFFLFSGALVYENYIRKDNKKQFVIFAIYLLAQSSFYLYALNTFRSSTLILLLIPLIFPIFSGLKNNSPGRIIFVFSMFALMIIHPLSFAILIIMVIFLFIKAKKAIKVLIAITVPIFLALLIFQPSLTRLLSLSVEELPRIEYVPRVFDILFPTFVPPFQSSAWPFYFSGLLDIYVSLATVIILLFIKLSFPTRFQLIAFIGIIFILIRFIQLRLFPIERLFMPASMIGITIITDLLVQISERVKFHKRPKLNQLIAISILTFVISAIVLNSYPKARSLDIDSFKFDEYKFLKNFVDSEQHTFNQSIILANVETLRYLNGIEGSIAYFEKSPKAFRFDFTHEETASMIYGAFQTIIYGYPINSINLASENNASIIYVVILHRLHDDIPRIFYENGETVLESNVGIIKKFYLNKDGLI